MSAYPPRIEIQPEKRDLIDPIWARHFNLMQDEIRATEATLGVNPHVAVADPADRTPNYATVGARIRSTARGEPMCVYSGRAIDAQVIPNQHVRPALTVAQDTHGGATAAGFRLPETGYWVINLKADWPSTSASQVHPTIRAAGIEINGVDLGLTDSVMETSDTRDNLSTQVTWQERLRKGTDVSINLRAANADADLNPLPANAYLRVYLVRCMADGEIAGLPNAGWPVEPGPPPFVPPGPGTHRIPDMRDPISVSPGEGTRIGDHLIAVWSGPGFTILPANRT